MKILRFMAGFALGVLVGGTLILLLTPQSGPEIRGRIQRQVAQILSEARQAAEARRDELQQQIAEATRIR